jgi:enoyl-[acyl-carrier protein] reductase III
MGAELAPEGIIVNAVSGGVADTGALKHFERAELMLSYSRERTPAGRIITPPDLAGVVAFLCSSDAAMIVGQVIVVDGGSSVLM